MHRYRIFIAYEGTNFSGWQKQICEDGTEKRTVQQVVELAIKKTVREPINLVGASRTDSGVHAKMQVAAFTTKLPIRIPLSRLPSAITARLQDDVVVWKTEKVSLNFDPIINCREKCYTYTIVHGIKLSKPRPLFGRQMIYRVAQDLDIEKMRIASRSMIGKHDFASFTKSNHGRKSTVRTITSFEVVEINKKKLVLRISGDGFLWNMVRIIAGTLVEVGRGRFKPNDVKEIINSKDRSKSGPTLPSQGLCLEWILYDGLDAFDHIKLEKEFVKNCIY